MTDHVNRNALTGRFATDEAVKADPAGHVRETVPDPVTFWAERMNGAMLKLHVRGAGKAMVLHVFTGHDHGDPHDHGQWGFTSTVLDGGYVEEVFSPDGTSRTVEHRAGDRFRVEADHIHRIVALPTGMCVTLIEPDPHTGKDSGFYQWRDGAAFYRPWHRLDFQPWDGAA